jgi:hypothetical protein
VIAGTSTGDVQEVTLGVVHLLEIPLIRDRLARFLE